MVIAASEFKAKCLSIIDEVGETGESVVISKHGRPVATLVRYAGSAGTYPQQELLGSVRAAGDIVSPVFPVGTWESSARQ